MQKQNTGLKEIIYKPINEVGVQELQELLDETPLSLSEFVDRSGRLSQIISVLTKKNDEYKQKIKASGEEQIDGDYFTATLVAVNKVKISPTRMLKYLKERDQINLIDAVLDVKITDVRRYLGDVVVSELGKSANGDTKSLYIKMK